MINPDNELFRWGPIDGRPIYIDSFDKAFGLYPGFIGFSWPDTLGFIKDDKITFVIDYADLRNNGEKLFRKYVMDEKELKKGYTGWIKAADCIKKFEKKVKGLSGLSDGGLTELFREWNKTNIEFWLYGFLPELSNWGGEHLLKRKILEFNKLNFIGIFEALSAPEDISFFQKEELDLMKIKLSDDKEQLKKHQQEYYWLRNNYGFTEVLDISFFEEELDRISKEDAEKKIREIEKHTGKIKGRKEEIIKKYNISREITDIAEKLAYCVWWQDYRKKFIFIANHIVTQFMKEISKRKKIPFKDICYYLSDEIVKLLEKNSRIDAKERFDGFTMYYHEGGSMDYLAGKKAQDLIEPYIKIRISPNLKEIKGMVVSRGPGIVKGKAAIIFGPKDADRMDQGDILIAPMTSPDFIVAMRKAKAIITDEGGMTSHAAIVSRELNVPCIVGTKIATKVLKDGDLVEVDANKGVVRRLK